MDLQDYLVGCTVRIETRTESGTGFFIAPGLIIAPAHVVESPNGGEYPWLGDVTVHHAGRELAARTIRYAAGPTPDLAVLRADVGGHASAYLYAPVRSDDPLFACGYATKDGIERRFFPGADLEGAFPESTFGADSNSMAGAPILNLRTGGVCAIVGNDPRPGAGATSVHIIESLFPGIRDVHDAHHTERPDWFETTSSTGTVFAARAHLLAVRRACQEPIQPLVAPRSRAGAVDLMVPMRFKMRTEDGVGRKLVESRDLVARCESDDRGMMIVGPSGSGRSSILRYLGHSMALGSPHLGGRGRDSLFPIMIRANQLASREGGIENQILDAIRKNHGPTAAAELPPTFLSDLIETPGLRLVIMIDGVDEIQNSRDLADVVDVIGRIRNETAIGRRTRLVMTSKPATVEHFRYSDFDVFEIQPLDADAVRSAAERWLPDDFDAFLRDNGAPVRSGLLSSPLALSIALTLYERGERRLSRRLVDLYRELVETARDLWSAQNVRDAYGAEIVDHAVDILGFLALELLRSATVQDRTWMRQTAARYFIQDLKAGPAPAADLADRFVEFASKESFFLKTAGNRLYWTHNSFKDYFAALRLTRAEHEAGNAVKAIRSRWFDAHRGNAPAFAAAMLEDETEQVRIAREILSSGREERRDFLRNLIIDGARLPDDLIQDLTDELLAAAKGECSDYGSALRPSSRASFAFDLLVSLAHLPSAGKALETIGAGEDWPSLMREQARVACAAVS